MKQKCKNVLYLLKIVWMKPEVGFPSYCQHQGLRSQHQPAKCREKRGLVNPNSLGTNQLGMSIARPPQGGVAISQMSQIENE